jgi:Right handed beta helix region
MARRQVSAKQALDGGSRVNRLPPLVVRKAAGFGRGRCVVLLVVTSASAIAAFAGPASASTYHASDGASLAAAVASADANAGSSTIDLSAGTFLPKSTLPIRGDVTILGPSSAPGARLAGSAVEPFPSDLLLVEAHAKLTLSNVAVTAGGGGGIASAIDDSGALDLESSTVAGNSGPGVLVEPAASATVSNSTLSDGLGGGLIDDGRTNLVNSTVAYNEDGGIENRGTLNLTNTIVAENVGADCEGRANTSDHSLDSDGSCGIGALSKANPLLATGLDNNGGPTPTHALEAGSPAIGAGDESKCPAEDQRHFARAGGRCDIGAYQAGAAEGGGPGPPSSGGTGSAPSPGGSGLALVSVSGHGTVPGARRSRITFTVRAQVGHSSATFLYTDRARHVELRKLIVKSLAINGHSGTATLRGSGVETASGRRVDVTLVLVNHSGHRSLRIRLSNRYYESGGLLSGSITFTRGAARAT